MSRRLCFFTISIIESISQQRPNRCTIRSAFASGCSETAFSTDAGSIKKVFASISAKTGEGIDRLFAVLDEVLREQRTYLEKTIPYADTAELNRIRKYGQLLSSEYMEDGIHIRAYIPRELGL